VPFSTLQLHPDLLKGIRELGFARPTPIQADAIPPALTGRDVLACAQTGSGKTAAFLLPILHRLIDRPRRTTRALVLTPTRELAAQILEDFNALAVHTPLTGAAVYGGVGMGPQEHAFRSGVDLIVATPGRLLDHFRSAYAKLPGVEYLVLDEADRMLDMGFLPDIRRVLRHIPVKRQTLFFSATMPGPIATLSAEMLKNPVRINLQRQAAPAIGITQAVYPVPQDLKPALLVELLNRGLVKDVLVFTRTKHRANRLADHLLKSGVNATRIHGNRSQPQRTEALAGFKSGKYRVLVATDIAARGIDVEALGHVVNFDVPAVPEDYIHRVGRTGRAELTGDAFTFVAPEEETDLRAIERAVRETLPRVTLPDFDYKSRPQAKLEVPLAQRIAEIRARKAQERGRRAAKEAGGQGGRAGGPGAKGAGGQGSKGAGGSRPPGRTPGGGGGGWARRTPASLPPGPGRRRGPF
jgi:ATP-dependent RNA helicase RhlE